MSDILRLLSRIFAITLGLFLGCLVAGFCFTLLARLIVPQDFGQVSDFAFTFTLLVSVLGISSIFARAILLPALLLIIIFELFKRRDWLSYALAGIGLAVFTTGYSMTLIMIDGTTELMQTNQMIAIRTVCAIIGASTYWLFIGRNAGKWLPSERTATHNPT